MADALVTGDPAGDGVRPLDLADEQIIEVPGVVAGSPCGWLIADRCGKKDFGYVLQQSDATYVATETVVARFRDAHPRNELRRQVGYVTVQRLQDSEWLPVTYDWDPTTLFTWERTGGSLSPASEVEVQWHIPATTPAGTYRIPYRGEAKMFLSGTIESLSGATASFQVN